MKITNEDSSVDMAVVGQKIVVRLSDKTMAKAQKETDTAAVKDWGLRRLHRALREEDGAVTLGHQFELSPSPTSATRATRTARSSSTSTAASRGC